MLVCLVISESIRKPGAAAEACVEIRNRHGREGLDCGETGELGEDLGRQGCVTFPFGSVHRLLIPGRKRGLEAEVDTVVQSEETASLGGFWGVLMTARLQMHEQS